MGLFGRPVARFPQWLNGLLGGRKHAGKSRPYRWRRRPYPALAQAAYARSTEWGERRSRFHQEPAEIPAYEVDARNGNRAPARFRWRARWFRVTAVICSWQDSRPSVPDWPERGREYYLIETQPEGLYQIYFERARGRNQTGRWIIYRRVEILRRHR